MSHGSCRAWVKSHWQLGLDLTWGFSPMTHTQLATWNHYSKSCDKSHGGHPAAPTIHPGAYLLMLHAGFLRSKEEVWRLLGARLTASGHAQSLVVDMAVAVTGRQRGDSSVGRNSGQGGKSQAHCFRACTEAGAGMLRLCIWIPPASKTWDSDMRLGTKDSGLDLRLGTKDLYLYLGLRSKHLTTSLFFNYWKTCDYLSRSFSHLT